MHSLEDVIVVLVESGYAVTFSKELAKVRVNDPYQSKPPQIVDKQIFEVRCKHRSARPMYVSRDFDLAKAANELLGYVRQDAPVDMSAIEPS